MIRPSRCIWNTVTWPANNVKIPFVYLIKKLAIFSTRRPILVLFAMTLLAVGTMTLGIFTNLRIETDENILWTPTSSETITYGDYETSFYQGIREYNQALLAAQAETQNATTTTTTASTGTLDTYIIIHRKDGGNALSNDGMQKLFEIQDVLQAVFESHNVSDYSFLSLVTFFDNDIDQYSSLVKSDADIAQHVSRPLFIGNSITPLFTYDLFGYPTWSVDGPDVDGFGYPKANTTLLSTIKSYRLNVQIPHRDGAENIESAAINSVVSIRSQWESDTQNDFIVEVSSYRSFEKEFVRSIIRDLPLLPTSFFIMIVICCLVFFKRNQVKSSSLTVGSSAIVTVVLSLATCKFHCLHH